MSEEIWFPSELFRPVRSSASDRPHFGAIVTNRTAEDEIGDVAEEERRV
jgi:hypothetical protein